MKKLLVIFGIIVVAVLVEGIAFIISSKIPDKDTGIVEKEMTSFDEILHAAKVYQEQRKYDEAFELMRFAIDNYEAEDERARAGHQMGLLQFDLYRYGEIGSLDPAYSYLEAAFLGARDEDLKMDIGTALLDVADADEESDHFFRYIDLLLAINKSAKRSVDLWRRNFRYTLKMGTWQEMNELFAVADNLVVPADGWDEMLEEMRLRTDENILADPNWFIAYADAMETDQAEYLKIDLLGHTVVGLEKMAESEDPEVRAEAYLRIAKAMISVGRHEEAHIYLQRYMNEDPTGLITDALMLRSQISRAQGETIDAAQLASAMVGRFDFDRRTENEILDVVQLLEENRLYDEALKIIDGFLKISEKNSIDVAPLLARAVILEERKGRRENALKYMIRLEELGSTESYGIALREFLSIALNKGDYEGAEEWLQRFLDGLSPVSDAYHDALFALFEAKYWLNRPMLEQLFVGSAAVQSNPADERVAALLLRMASFVEEMGLHDLAISYYNRIGLLNFFKGDDLKVASSRNIGEQAMLGKARCLKKNGDWIDADHLLRDLCNRTASPLIRSEASVSWAELALRFEQRREAERRYDQVDTQMLSASDLTRYLLGRARLGEAQLARESTSLEEILDLLTSLSPAEQRKASFSFFNEYFAEAFKDKDQRLLRRVIDLAHQSDHSTWLPIQSYVLQVLFEEIEPAKLEDLSLALKEEAELGDPELFELSQTTSRLHNLNTSVKRHKKRKANE